MAVDGCPTHPDVRGKPGESRPKCGTRLVPAAADYTPFALDIALEPRALKPKQPGRVRLIVRDPATGAVVRRLEKVHDRVFHPFVVGRDLEYFAHVHPLLRPNGALDVGISVPRPGAYELIADFTGAIATGTSALRIGGNSVWGEYFKGAIDEVRIYNRARAASEIQADMGTAVQ